MRDDSTVRLNAAAAPDDDSSRTTAMETAKLRATPASSGDASAADPPAGSPEGGDRRIEATTRAVPRAAEEGHMPGPGLVIPPAARERREPQGPPEDRPVMPGPPPSDPGESPGAAPQDDRGGRRGHETPAAPGPAAPISERPAVARTTATTTAATQATQATRATRTAAPPHRPPRPVAAPSARPPAPPRPSGPRHTGPGRPPAGPVAATPRTAAGPSRARTTPQEPRGRASGLRRRAGGIAGGLALGLVAVVAASWTLLVPPDGRSDERIAAAPAKPAAPAVRWVRTNGDEFDGQALDRTRWNVYNSVGGFGNGQRRPSAVTQDDGLLTVTARPRLNGGTSGGISMSRGQLHGRWEFRARADPGNGYSPAVLLWPDSERFPIDGELDMLESPNGNRNNASAYVHYGADNRTRGAQVPVDLTQWHTFAFEWLPDRITWYVDGRKSWEITDRSVFPTKPMHLCIQLDQGPAPKFLPGPDASTPDEVRMQVDWARQYRVG